MFSHVWNSYFPDKFTTDEREYFLNLTIPNVGELGVRGFPIMFWIQSGLLMLFQSVLSAILAIVIYFGIVVDNRREDFKVQFLTWTVMIPLVLYSPFRLIPWLDIRNIGLILSLGAQPSQAFFRILEALWGTSPSYATESWKSYVNYHLSPVTFQFEPKSGKVLRATPLEIRQKGHKVLISICQFVILLSIMEPCSYQIFRRERTTWMDYLYWGNLLNNFLMACLTCVWINTVTLLVGFLITLIWGISVMEVNDHALTHCQGPSDFWRRWNRMTGGILKRGIYKPLCMSHFARPVAAFGTFACSSILHEYLLTILALRSVNAPDEGYKPAYGNQSMFFLWCGIFVVLEQGGYWEELKKKVALAMYLPQPVVTAIVILSALPVAHWFTDEYVGCKVFSDYSNAFPRIVLHRTP